MPRAASVVSLGFAFAATLFCAQQPLKSFTINVTATDPQGQPADGLSAADFQLSDNGKTKPITSAVSQGAGQSPALFVVLDLFNADLSERGLAAKEVSEALEKNERNPNIFLYLITPAGSPFRVHGVTETPSDGVWTKQGRTLLNDSMSKVNGLKGPINRMPVNRVGPTWDSLFVIAAEMERVPGPKSLVWITQGIPDGFLGVDKSMHINPGPLQAFTARMNRMRAAAYAVQSKPSEGLEPEGEGTSGETLDQLTALTGGKLYREDVTTQLLGSLLNQPPLLNYQISFSAALDGKYHKLRITTTRPGVKISAPERYYAVEPPQPFGR